MGGRQYNLFFVEIQIKLANVYGTLLWSSVRNCTPIHRILKILVSAAGLYRSSDKERNRLDSTSFKSLAAGLIVEGLPHTVDGDK